MSNVNKDEIILLHGETSGTNLALSSLRQKWDASNIPD